MGPTDDPGHVEQVVHPRLREWRREVLSLLKEDASADVRVAVTLTSRGFPASFKDEKVQLLIPGFEPDYIRGGDGRLRDLASWRSDRDLKPQLIAEGTFVAHGFLDLGAADWLDAQKPFARRSFRDPWIGAERLEPALLDVTATPGVTPCLDYTVSDIGVIGTGGRLKLPGGADATGAGVLVGVVDYGFDFAHPHFVNTGTGGSKSTRLKAFWDQNKKNGRTPNPPPIPGVSSTLYSESWAVFWNASGQSPAPTQPIDTALAQGNPYAALRYDPHEKYYTDEPIFSAAAIGAHGTHVADIAIGHSSAGHSEGVAPGADLIFVQVRKPTLGSGANYGAAHLDIMNAVKFILWQATVLGKPVVINLSLNYNTGPHHPRGEWEQILDGLATTTTGHTAVIVVAAGNTYGEAWHVTRAVGQQWKSLAWVLEAGDPTVNILQIYYASASADGDQMRIRLKHADDVFPPITTHPDGQQPGAAGTRVDIATDDRTRSSINKRPLLPETSPAPQTDLWKISVELEADQKGNVAKQKDQTWNVELRWAGASETRVHCWIDRDNFEGDSQSSFAREIVKEEDRFATLGSLACGTKTIAVGAYAVIDRDNEPWAFAASSSGRTASYTSQPAVAGDRRPDIAAPGVNVVAARSKGGRLRNSDLVAPADADNVYAMVVPKSGTSMAVPAVVGTIALMLQKNPAATRAQIVQALTSTAVRRVTPTSDGFEEPPKFPDKWDPRFGYGALDAAAAVAAI